MSGQDESSKTEPPTAKKLRDSRKKGDVPKAPDVGITIGFFFALLLMWLVFNGLVSNILTLTEHVLLSPGQPFQKTLIAISSEAVDVLIRVTAIVVIPLALFGLVVEFLVIGPVITSEKFKPSMTHFNFVEGMKRMFGVDNLVELLKSIVKTTALIVIASFAIRAVIGDLMLLPGAEPESVIKGMWYLTVRIFGWVSAFYFLLMFVDTAYQKHIFEKKMKMSMRDIRDELKDIEGDPMLKGARKDLGHEWAQEAPTDAARNASVLIVNPVHVAIAIRYDADEARIPQITARGEELTARSMRDAAARSGVPILRNEQLARSLLDTNAPDNLVPREFFDIIVEVILWAQATRVNLVGGKGAPESPIGLPAASEDLSDYTRRVINRPDQSSFRRTGVGPSRDSGDRR